MKSGWNFGRVAENSVTFIALPLVSPNYFVLFASTLILENVKIETLTILRKFYTMPSVSIK